MYSVRISGDIINQNKYIIKEDKNMMKTLKKVNWKKLGIFVGGVLFVGLPYYFITKEKKSA